MSSTRLPDELRPQHYSSSDMELMKEPSRADIELQGPARHCINASENLTSQTPFFASSNSVFDPKSAKFDAKNWSKAFWNLLSTTSPRRVVGIAFEDLNVYGHGRAVDYQESVGNAPFRLLSAISNLFCARQQRIDILHHMEGLLLPGEMLCVLGPPGSGCSSLLKTIAGDTYGLRIDEHSNVNYHGITPGQMHSRFRNQAIYTAEVDAHFPNLTVNDTLLFAAMASTPHSLPPGVDSRTYATCLRDVIMAMFGISHTCNTKVGNDFIRGVSGGERKRVTIAEATLSSAPLQCWDNSTRGLDSANATEFCRVLRLQSDVFNFASCVAIYQAPQAAFEFFDKVTVLYEGRQIYFGPASSAKAYFEQLGFLCPEGKTDPDFLTSMTSPHEREIKKGFENSAPRTAEDFERAWKSSSGRQNLLLAIQDYNSMYPFEGENYRHFTTSRQIEKSPRQRKRSPFTLSYWGQIRLCLWRCWQNLQADPSVTIVMLIGNFFEAIIIASIFFNLPQTTSSFFSRGAVLFMLILLNAFASILEIIGLYAKRTIIEKHHRYALYHPSAEAIASIIMDMPYKITNAMLVNTTLYFMTNLKREPGAYFFFLLISFTLLLSMSMFFRLFASLTKTLAQALAPAGLVLLAMMLYTGFAIPIDYMRGWASWMRYINPIAYGFESIMLNEFAGRYYACSSLVPYGPDYKNIGTENRVCSTKGSNSGQWSVSGTEYLQVTFNYVDSHKWRNWGILLAFTIGLAILHLVVSDIVAAQRSKGEVLLFRRTEMRRAARSTHCDEETVMRASEKEVETSDSETEVEKQTSIFSWKDVTYKIKVKGEERTLLDQVDGWVKPGTVTALMGVSGAGKTTLLDVLASRTSMGVITGEILVDGQQRDESFQRKTGYAQQQDLHLHTSTVREALTFSALLRQPPKYTKDEKIAYVNVVIDLLNMSEYADAIVGVPGEGLNVEQRKRLTIGIEIVARPSLLLFLDEPTSGLDSQTSWSICNLLTKLAKNGQAILCTVHQPSATLFQQFDRLLLLAKGGRTVYFGEIGKNSRTLIDYFVRNGGADCAPGVNPAEYMLETIGAASGFRNDIDWHSIWRSSREYVVVQEELSRLRSSISTSPTPTSTDAEYRLFAAPLATQLHLVLLRTFQQYWRTPSYIYSKMLLCIGSAIFIGFSFFMTDTTQQGLQNQMFGVFIFLFVVIQLILQIMPMFVVQRTLYESRERQSCTYHWQAFLTSEILVELCWNTLVAVICFLVWYYPMGLYRIASWTDAVNSRAGLTFLFVWSAFVFASSFAHALIAGIASDEVASAIANIFSIMMYAFCGILAGPDTLPGFWIFMYRVNPFRYLVDGLLSSSLANAPVRCATNEFLRFNAPSGQSCSDYMTQYINDAGGYLLNANASGEEMCQYCPIDSTNTFLSAINCEVSIRWFNWGILWVYIAANLGFAVLAYKLFRVPSKTKSKAVEVKNSA